MYQATYVPLHNPGSSGLCLSATHIVSCLEGLQLFDKSTGKWIWSFLPSGYLRKPALANDTIVFASEGVVFADMMIMAVSEGGRHRELWRYRVPAPYTDYTISADRVYLTSGWLDIADSNGLLAVLSLETGKEIWTATVEDAVGLFPPTVTPDAVYVSGMNGVYKYGK